MKVLLARSLTLGRLLASLLASRVGDGRVFLPLDVPGDAHTASGDGSSSDDATATHDAMDLLDEADIAGDVNFVSEMGDIVRRATEMGWKGGDRRILAAVNKDLAQEAKGITETLPGQNAQALYDQIDAQLQLPEFQPRRMFEQFKIEVLCTTDAATDELTFHQQIRDSGWSGQIRPTFRPDALVNLDAPGWQENLAQLEQVSGSSIRNYPALIAALEARRAFFKSMGATATDHAALTALTLELTPAEADAIFQRALAGKATPEDAARFTAHMLVEMARMSVEDGLVMQLHVGSLRNHNPAIFQTFGQDKGADIPIASEFTRNLRPLLDRFGTDPRLTLILFNLDESTYARELAPLAGHYPALKLGPPWWFHDSPNGMRRYFEGVMETAGIYNTAGFNDDTRAFPSIPARHELWRRVACDWVAGLLVRHIIAEDEAQAMARALAYDLAKAAYKL